MRVISGENRGRKLKAVNGRMTRPTTDKVKETIFNMIGPFFDGGTALDLYGGCGGLGIEALSRGINKAVFVDRAGAACQTIRDNVRLCGYENRSKILQLDAARALGKLSKNEQCFNLVFLDPPYAKQQIQRDMETLLRQNMLAEHAIIVAEHEENVKLADVVGGRLIRKKYRTYQGQTAVSIYYFQLEQGSDPFE
ncbi:16S rRNA (guanine(966)-N(2))-methyltransferase RsmD [Sporolactobacillus shoreicorticis]|uniref:16S rRNA (Guanine(966)-N(2))-methyltransferase RsmD n=1 Tax=Sporolactobacillus shoreicorticis TaxID=1923877 RepID=A0ABW5S549_9BACL|nr:16S rRNA (guanine(966)-N(2))-methyltransferase RsmD [Sporolactobacillus shoreicorticis]MCO7126282.1 16S rRNA (guanine(966)-N(2))-methyltransferase RsmD [Sporolactobacillus shoreicorticis]